MEPDPPTVLDQARRVVVAGLSGPDVLSQMPTGVLVVDAGGVVRYANQMVLEILGWSEQDAVGRSMLDVIVPDDHPFIGEIIANGRAYFGSVLGPVRVRFVDVAGRTRQTEFWARELQDRSGYLLVVPNESTSDTLADAVREIANGAPIEDAMRRIVAGLAAHPMDGVGCVFRIDDGGLVPVTPWPLRADLIRPAERSPWDLAARSGVAVDVHDVDTLDETVRAELVGHGYGSVWCRPVISRSGDVTALVVVLRDGVQPPSPNQHRRLDEIVAIAALAFDHLEYRSTLERAAFFDPLTGAASRARLQREVEAGILGAAIVYIDLDGFKEINDTFGHGAGDAVLAEVAQRLERIVRADDLVVRIGGDEFVLVVRNVSEDVSLRIAARVVDELALPYEVSIGDGFEPVLVSATASAGVCVQAGDTPFDVALQAADEALSQAKQAGKRRVHVVSR
jgi:diguanylate cyclase (GGDEF)-like protein/PAS domain S-box-containing protein